MNISAIPKEIAEHKLGILTSGKHVFQEKRVFAKSRQEVIHKEVQDLLAT